MQHKSYSYILLMITHILIRLFEMTEKHRLDQKAKCTLSTSKYHTYIQSQRGKPLPAHVYVVYSDVHLSNNVMLLLVFILYMKAFECNHDMASMYRCIKNFCSVSLLLKYLVPICILANTDQAVGYCCCNKLVDKLRHK